MTLHAARSPCFALLALLALVSASGCDDDDGTMNIAGDVPRNDLGVDVGSDASATATSATDGGTSGTDTTNTSTTSATDTAIDFVEEVIEPPVDDFACNVVDRIAACESALLASAPIPTDPTDLLFYVNRWYAIPAEYPISETSTWTPCQGGDPGVAHDLVCLPPQYVTKDNALRGVAWESDAPAGLASTHDGLAVGHQGKIGYLAMFEAAKAEAGYDLFVLSGFRSYATQQATFNGHMNREISNGLSPTEAELEASTYSAQPGHSEHQLATTADLTYRQPNGAIYPGLDQSMADAAAIQWVHRNSHRFGIVLTYDRDKVETTQYVYEPWHHRFVGVEAADAMRECLLNTEEFLAARYGTGALPEYAGNSLILYHESDLRGHVTVPPGSWIRPGEAFEKVWRIRNTGTINWHGYRLEHVSGETFGAGGADLTCIRVGQTVELGLDMTAPTTPGTYEGVWRVLDPGGNPFGDDVTVRIVVSDTQPDADPYLFVRVDDLSNATGGADPGADMDAIVLKKVDGSLAYATSVQSYTAAPSAVSNGNPNDILGSPDAFLNYPNVSTCNVDAGFVSLGGAGTIIVEMGAEIETGDNVEALEIGGCDFGSGTAITDRIEVQVSVSPDPSSQWVLLGNGTGPSIQFAVPELPAATR